MYELGLAVVCIIRRVIVTITSSMVSSLDVRRSVICAGSSITNSTGNNTGSSVVGILGTDRSHGVTGMICTGRGLTGLVAEMCDRLKMSDMGCLHLMVGTSVSSIKL